MGVVSWFDIFRVDSRFAPSQWETSLRSNAVSHWLGANLESGLYMMWSAQPIIASFVVLFHLISPCKYTGSFFTCLCTALYFLIIYKLSCIITLKYMTCLRVISKTTEHIKIVCRIPTTTKQYISNTKCLKPICNAISCTFLMRYVLHDIKASSSRGVNDSWLP